jgi:hypothetical protein
MRALILGVLLVVFVVAANSEHGTPPAAPYPDCATAVTYPLENPNAYCLFNGTPITVAQYAMLTVPNAR